MIGVLFFILITTGITTGIPPPTQSPKPTTTSTLPPRDQYARMARYVVHKSDWLSIATISASWKLKGYPYVNLKSTSDGPVDKGFGVPYIYLTDLDVSGRDLKHNSRCTVMMSLAQTEYCSNNRLDQQDPRCVRVILSGRVRHVYNNTDEYSFAQNALFSRHPTMRTWPQDHDFYIAKVAISQIGLLDNFGGMKSVRVKDYFDANPYEDESIGNTSGMEFSDDILVNRI